MAEDWDSLEDVDATERIIRAALSCGASQIHFSCDNAGGTVFFLSDGALEFYAQVSIRCRDLVRNYLRVLAGLDSWAPPPLRGFGVFTCDGENISLEVCVIKGSVDTDVTVNIFR